MKRKIAPKGLPKAVRLTTNLRIRAENPQKAQRRIENALLANKVRATQMANQSETHATQMATLIQTQTAQSDAHAAAQAEQTRLLVESISLSGPQSITNNTTNNQFNLNVFLNEDCKDA